MSPSTNRLKTTFESVALPSITQYSTGLKTGVTGVAFWSAIVLPFLHLPLLATGLEKQSVTVAFAILVALNVVAAVLGQSYASDDG